SGKVATKWAENLIEAIEHSRKTTLDRFLYALGIQHVGESTAKALATWFGEIELIRHLPWPLLKLVPDIGGEVARAIDAFFQQGGNQAVIDQLLKRGGVSIADAHPPSAKLRAALTLANVLTELEIPKLTEKRAEQVAVAFDSLEALMKAKQPALVEAGLRKETAESLHAYLESDAGRVLVKR